MKQFPGPKTEAVLEKAKKYYATTTQDSRIVIAGGDGAIVTDVDGYQFYDLHCDASVNNLGRNDSGIRRQIIEQLSTGNFFSEHHNAPNEKASELAKILCEKSPVQKPSKVFFSNSGAEANEAARKLCAAYRHRMHESGRRTAIYFKNGFAGRTKGVLAGTSSKSEVQSIPFLDHCDTLNSIYLPYPTKKNKEETLKSFDNLILARVDRILIELSCQGEGGIIPADIDAVLEIITRAQNAGIICIVDAIQCGMGRDGSMFGCDHLIFSMEPDILTLGKALGGGLTIGATIFRSDLDFEKNGMHSNTFGGGPLVMSVALEVFPRVEHLVESGAVRNIENILSGYLFRICSGFQNVVEGEPRGRGAMWAVEFVNEGVRERVVKCAEEIVVSEGIGLRLLGAGRKSVRFMPPLTISDEDLKKALSIFEKVLFCVSK